MIVVVQRSDVRPVLPYHDIPDGTVTQTAISGYLPQAHPALAVLPPYLDYIRSGQLRCGMTLSSWKALRVSARTRAFTTRHPLWMQSRSVAITNCRSSLRDHVGHVLGVRAEKEMVRTAAGRVIAPMTNLHPRGDRAIRECVGKAVCMCPPLTVMDAAIPEVVSLGASPQPATVGAGTINAAPEIFGNLLSGTLRAHLDSPPGVMPPAVASSAGVYARRIIP